MLDRAVCVLFGVLIGMVAWFIPPPYLLGDAWPTRALWFLVAAAWFAVAWRPIVECRATLASLACAAATWRVVTLWLDEGREIERQLTGTAFYAYVGLSTLVMMAWMPKRWVR